MAENSKIGWTTHTFNPWVGCAKVSPGCDHCYAEAQDMRFKGGHWGTGAPRRRTTDANWRKPLKWNEAAKASGERPWVFCGSLCDWADNEVPDEWRRDLYELWQQTPYLRWQPLTKRMGNVPKTLPDDWTSGAFDHVGMMATCVNQKEFDRDVPKLLKIPAAWHGVSLEPLLDWIDIREYADELDHVIVGGESGPQARPFPVSACRQIIEDCRVTDKPVYVKQMGRVQLYGTIPCSNLKHPKGEDMSEWPVDLRIRQMPRFAGKPT